MSAGPPSSTAPAASPRPASLMDLPAEVLLEVLLPALGAKDIAAVSRVNKQLHVLAVSMKHPSSPILRLPRSLSQRFAEPYPASASIRRFPSVGPSCHSQDP